LRFTWRGHAYTLAHRPGRHVVDDGVLLAGDAAGLAYAQSGEGIRPAIESGLLAAATIVDAHDDYSAARLSAYARSLRARFSTSPPARVLATIVPHGVSATLARPLLANDWFVRHVVLDRWFLHAHTRALAAA